MNFNKRGFFLFRIDLIFEGKYQWKENRKENKYTVKSNTLFLIATQNKC